LITVDPVVAAGLSHDEVRAAVERAVAAVNDGRSRYEQIRRFRILPREFTLEQDEMTPTLKLRRKVIVEHFADELAALYETAAQA
jgi:long-chain acyl-CoA synthetase